MHGLCASHYFPAFPVHRLSQVNAPCGRSDDSGWSQIAPADGPRVAHGRPRKPKLATRHSASVDSTFHRQAEIQTQVLSGSSRRIQEDLLGRGALFECRLESRLEGVLQARHPLKVWLYDPASRPLDETISGLVATGSIVGSSLRNGDVAARFLSVSCGVAILPWAGTMRPVAEGKTTPVPPAR